MRKPEGLQYCRGGILGRGGRGAIKDGGAGAGWFFGGVGEGILGGNGNDGIIDCDAGAGWFFGGGGVELPLLPLQICVPALGSSTHLPLRQMS